MQRFAQFVLNRNRDSLEIFNPLVMLVGKYLVDYLVRVYPAIPTGIQRYSISASILSGIYEHEGVTVYKYQFIIVIVDEFQHGPELMVVHIDDIDQTVCATIDYILQQAITEILYIGLLVSCSFSLCKCPSHVLFRIPLGQDIETFDIFLGIIHSDNKRR